MDIFIGILMVVEVLVCLLLILIVLMQRPRQEGLGASFGGDMMSQIAGAQTTNVLQKFTVYLAIILFALTLGISMLTARQQTAKSDTQLFEAPPPPEAPAEQPKVEVVPTPEASEKGETAPAPAAKVAPEKKSETPTDTAPAAAPKAPEQPKAETPKAQEPAKTATPAMKEPGEAAPAPAAPAKAEETPAAPKSDS